MLKRRSRGSAVRSIREMLRFLGFRVKRTKHDTTLTWNLAVSEQFDEDLESVVIDFQRSEGLLQDGVVGSITMGALEDAYSHRVLELTSPGVDALLGLPERFVFERIPVDRYQRKSVDEPDGQTEYVVTRATAGARGADGYPYISMRQDAAPEFRKIQEKAHAQGAILPVSAGTRHLRTRPNSNRSALSFHYLGLAVDLHFFGGMVDPESDPFVVSQVAPRTWRVYARCSRSWVPDAAVPPQSKIDGVVSYNSRSRPVSLAGCFLDLTALFAEHGFRPIRAKRRFEEGGSLMGADWWHFQYDRGLVEGASTFGQELLKTFSEETLAATPPWRYRDRVYGVNWARKEESDG
jgi:hypothetical protein